MRENLAVLFRHRRKIVTICLVATVVAAAGTFLSSKVYESNARILLRHNRAPLQINASLAPGGVGIPLDSRDEVATEVEIFRSPIIFRRTVETLGAETVLREMSWKWDWLRELPGTWRRSATAWISARIHGSFLCSPSSPDRARSSETSGMQMARGWMASFGVCDLVAPAADGGVPEDRVAAARDALFSNLEAEPMRQSDVFAVSFRAPSPEFASLVLNSMIDAYLQHHIDVRQGHRAEQAYEEESARLKGQLQEARERLRQFREETGVVDMQEQRRQLLQDMNDAEQRLRNTRREIAASDARIEELKRQLASQSSSISISRVTTRNPLIDRLREQLAQIDLELQSYVPGSVPAREAEARASDIRRQIASVRESGLAGTQTRGLNQTYLDLQKEIALEEGRRKSLEAQLVVADDLQATKERLVRLESYQARLNELEREATVQEEALNLYLRKQQDVRISGALDREKISNVTAIEPAFPNETPVAPRKATNILLGLVLGLFAGLMSAYGIEYFRRTITNREELSSVANGLPVISAIPAMGRRRKSIAFDSYQVQELCAAIVLALRRNGTRRIMVVSALPGEGKSTISSVLTSALSREGLNVLAVEAPSPDVSGRQTPRLSLRGPQEAAPNPELDLLESDVPNVWNLPQTTLNSGYMKYSALLADRLRQLENRFDIAIVDGTAIGVRPDSISAVRAVDAVVVIVEAERTPAFTVQKTVEAIDNAGGKVLGLVLNRYRQVIPRWAYSLFLTPRRGSLNV